MNDREIFIEKYLRKELDETEQSLFEKHFMDCEECFNELEHAKQLMELVKEEGKVLFPEYSNKPAPSKATQSGGNLLIKIFSPKWFLRPSIAYTFIAALLIISGIYLLKPSDDQNLEIGGEEQISGTDTETPAETDQIPVGDDELEIEDEITQVELYAANFIESEELEYLINQQVRGSGAINVISPEIGTKVSDELFFSWTSEIEGKLYLKILNNREDVVMSLTPGNNELLIDIGENELEPGVYYWKLETEDELLYIGKFLIKK